MRAPVPKALRRALSPPPIMGLAEARSKDASGRRQHQQPTPRPCPRAAAPHCPALPPRCLPSPRTLICARVASGFTSPVGGAYRTSGFAAADPSVAWPLLGGCQRCCVHHQTVEWRETTHRFSLMTSCAGEHPPLRAGGARVRDPEEPWVRELSDASHLRRALSMRPCTQRTSNNPMISSLVGMVAWWNSLEEGPRSRSNAPRKRIMRHHQCKTSERA